MQGNPGCGDSTFYFNILIKSWISTTNVIMKYNVRLFLLRFLSHLPSGHHEQLFMFRSLHVSGVCSHNELDLHTPPLVHRHPWVCGGGHQSRDHTETLDGGRCGCNVYHLLWTSVYIRLPVSVYMMRWKPKQCKILEMIDDK